MSFETIWQHMLAKNEAELDRFKRLYEWNDLMEAEVLGVHRERKVNLAIGFLRETMQGYEKKPKKGRAVARHLSPFLKEEWLELYQGFVQALDQLAELLIFADEALIREILTQAGFQRETIDTIVDRADEAAREPGEADHALAIAKVGR